MYVPMLDVMFKSENESSRFFSEFMNKKSIEIKNKQCMIIVQKPLS